MIRERDPTSKILMTHYRANYTNGSTAALADLIVNIALLRNTMSREIVKLCELGKMPWLKIEGGRLTEASKRAVDEVFLTLGGKVFFTSVEPMKSRSKCPRRGWGELVSELITFAKRAEGMAYLWAAGENAVENIAAAIRKVPGFGGKGFRAIARLCARRGVGLHMRDARGAYPPMGKV